MGEPTIIDTYYSSSFPLHRAIKDQDIEKVNELLSIASANNLNINAEDDSNGNTPLIEACVVGNETLVTMLLQAGCPAQPTTISSSSSTTTTTTTTRHNSHHAEEPPLRAACMAGQSHIIPILLNAGSDPNNVMSGGGDDGNNRITTPLMGACNLNENVPESKSALCTRILLDDPRTDPTVINSFGETALDLAISRNYEECIAMIKQALKEAKWLSPNYVMAGIPYWLSDDDHDDTNIKEEEGERCPPYCRRRRQPLPSRDDDDNCLIFPDYPEFRPNLSPDQVLKAGSFGGTYFRSIVSKTVGGRTFSIGVHLEFPTGWFEGLDVSKMVTSSIYRKENNKYNVKSGNDLNFWERKGWMREQDPYGWFQWYCRFYLGRRSQDDPRQVSRWVKAIGNKGRWRTFLAGQCVKADKGWDDYSVSPVTRQTLLHWGYELTESDFNSLAPAIRKGKSVIYMGVVSTTRTGETAIGTDTNVANSKSRPKRRRRK